MKLTALKSVDNELESPGILLPILWHIWRMLLDLKSPTNLIWFEFNLSLCIIMNMITLQNFKPKRVVPELGIGMIEQV